jgi:hypothetical protein
MLFFLGFTYFGDRKRDNDSNARTLIFSGVSHCEDRELVFIFAHEHQKTRQSDGYPSYESDSLVCRCSFYYLFYFFTYCSVHCSSLIYDIFRCDKLGILLCAAKMARHIHRRFQIWYLD